MIRIRLFVERDWAATWQILEPVFRAGETYAFSPDITEQEAYAACAEEVTKFHGSARDDGAEEESVDEDED